MWNFCHFWSNFEIADLEWFRSKEYGDLFAWLEERGGLYFERVHLSFLQTQPTPVSTLSSPFPYQSNQFLSIMLIFKSLTNKQIQWGDAPIHSLAAALLLDPSQIHYFSDYGYLHDGLQRCPRNAPGGQLQMDTLLGGGYYDEEKEGGLGCRCTCSGEAAWLKPDCQNAVNRAVGGRREVFGK